MSDTTPKPGPHLFQSGTPEDPMQALREAARAEALLELAPARVRAAFGTRLRDWTSEEIAELVEDLGATHFIDGEHVNESRVDRIAARLHHPAPPQAPTQKRAPSSVFSLAQAIGMIPPKQDANA